MCKSGFLKDEKMAQSLENKGIGEFDMALSPMMQEYLKTKEQYSDAILFYRLGDFYEMFFDDALTATKELELTLTGKDCGLEERAPMCGGPLSCCGDLYQAADRKRI